MRHVPTPVAVVGAVAAALLVVSGCGSGSAGGAGGGGGHEENAITAQPLPSSGTPSSASGKTIAISIEDGTTDPSGERVEVRAGSPVTLLIDADAAGELHVHSTPEHHIEYPAGRSSATLTLDQPGIVDVESHTLDKLIVQLEVR